MPSAAKKKNPRTRDVMKQESKDALVQAALELFAAEGIDLPSLDAICDRAGYTRGAFYVHFASRDDLLVAVMDKVGESYLASVFAGLQELADAPKGKRFGAAVRRFVESVKTGSYPLMSSGPRGPLVRPHQLLDACARSPSVKKRYSDLVATSIETVSHLVAHDQAEGGLREDVDPRGVASLALAVILGAQTMSEVGVDLDAGTLARTIEKMLAKP